MQKLFAFFFLLSVAMAMTSQAQDANNQYLDQLPPLIDREVFFGDPEIASAQISPDGNFISFRKPYRDVMNVWVKEREEPFDAARPLTADTTRPISSYFWSRDSRYILFVQDKGGDENFNVYAVDPQDEAEVETGVPQARNLTDLQNVRAYIYAVPRNDPQHIVVGLNDRDPQLHDVYRVNIATGDRKLLIQNNQNIAGWDVDDDGNVRLASRQTPDGGTEILQVNGEELNQIYACSNEEACGAIRFHEDGRRFYLVTNTGDDADLVRLVLFDPETGEEELIEKDPEGEVDFGGALFSDLTNEILATYYVGDRLRVYPRDEEFARDYERVTEQLPRGDIYPQGRSADEHFSLFAVTSDVDPGAVYLYDRETEEAEFLYRPRPDLPSEHLAEMQPIRYTARDGLEIPAYLTVPKGVEARDLPVVVNPHGGPWARDTWGYDATAQFLANRGYAVLQINFRGSTGYGKEFLNLGNKEWGTGYMQHDITDGVRYLIEEGIADPDRIGIYGGSYGGYATLAGLAFTPDLYAAGVSFVGPSSIITLLESIPPYWEPVRKIFSVRVGDLDDPEDRQMMREQSPLYSAEQIRAPLLVIQGANDPRVKQHESDQIVVAMRDLGRDVEYLVAPDEGHGFAGRENRLAYITAMERFFSEHLGGRFQEEVPDYIREQLEAITVDVETVTLREIPDEAAQAATGPLPVGDPDLIQHGTMTYKATLQMGEQRMEFDVERHVAEAEYEGRKVLRLVDSMQMPMGATVDTTDLDAATLLPIRRQTRQGPATVSVAYSESRISGEMNAQGNRMPINAELEAPVYSDGGGLDLVISALPLEVGYETYVRSFDLMSQSANVAHVEVLEEETIDISAGTYEAYKVKMTPVDADSGEGTMWISTATPHKILKGERRLPAQMGGALVTIELSSDG